MLQSTCTDSMSSMNILFPLNKVKELFVLLGWVPQNVNSIEWYDKH